MKKRSNHQHPFLRFLFVVYCSIMLWLLFGRSSGWTEGLSYQQMLQRNINLIPLYTIKNYLQVVIHRTNDEVFTHCLINLLGNVLLFIPIGYLLPKIWKKQQRFFVFLLSVLLLIIIIELTQLFTLLGSFDIDDIILNLTGMIIGYLIWRITK